MPFLETEEAAFDFPPTAHALRAASPKRRFHHDWVREWQRESFQLLTGRGKREASELRCPWWVRTPENLDVVRQVVQPREVQPEPGQWKEISQEVSRQLDYAPGKFFWLETVRPKYVRADQREVAPVVAPAPERASGQAAPGLLAWLLVCKFADALPFYRLESIFRERRGVFIARQQMVQWMRQGTFLLEGIYRCIQAQLQASRYVQLDETPIDYLDPGKGRCSQGYLWTALVAGQCVWCSSGTPVGRSRVWTRCWGVSIIWPA